MLLTAFKRVIRAGWVNLRRQSGLTFATILILVLTIGLVTSLLLFRQVSNFLISNLEEKVDVSIYFKEISQEDDILQAKEKLSEIPEVKKVEYISKEKALDSFLEKHKDNPVLIDSLKEVGGNPFLASLNVRAGEASQYAAVVNFLEKAPFQNLIEKVDYYQRKPVIERIFSLSSGVSRAGIFLSLILTVLALVVAFNQVRLAIYNSREEISIQRLVGASNWFIRGPFLFQGAVSGVFSAIICLLIFLPLLFFLSPKLEIFFPELNIFSYFIGNLFKIFLIQLTAGLAIGVFSSLIAIRKYLKV